jgi:hypothetical protein
MNAQVNWKRMYRMFKRCRSASEKRSWRGEMRDEIHAAALERKLAAAQRIIETQAQRAQGILIFLNDGDTFTWLHVKDNDTSDPIQCLYCGEAWPCISETVKESLEGIHDKEISDALGLAS